ncbi:MAG: endonuclease III [Muribaculaceae bacterium]|nr:endonuclease III [Muribaculaceae bacterium]
MSLKERYCRVLARFAAEMPEPKTELHYDTPFHLLLAVILSAQCTDKRVNIVTPPLFEAFPDAASLAASDEETVYGYIRSVSYPNNKTKSLLGAARKLTEDFGGEVPDNIDDLLTIPGVGRKTANVMLSVVWNRAAMAVDTHVFRVSERIGLTTGSKTPRQTEEALVKNIPEEQIPLAHHWLILHGRYVCKARRPDCLNCVIKEWCRYYSKAGNKESPSH